MQACCHVVRRNRHPGTKRRAGRRLWAHLTCHSTRRVGAEQRRPFCFPPLLVLSRLPAALPPPLPVSPSPTRTGDSGSLSRAKFSGLSMRCIQKGLRPSLSPWGMWPVSGPRPGSPESAGTLLSSPGVSCPQRGLPGCPSAPNQCGRIPPPAPLRPSFHQNARRCFLSWASDMSAWKWGTHSLLQDPGGRHRRRQLPG